MKTSPYLWTVPVSFHQSWPRQGVLVQEEASLGSTLFKEVQRVLAVRQCASDVRYPMKNGRWFSLGAEEYLTSGTDEEEADQGDEAASDKGRHDGRVQPRQ